MPDPLGGIAQGRAAKLLGEGIRHRPMFFRLFRSSGQILLPRCLMNGLNNVDKTDGEYS